ncbi:MAG: MBL fold metallo-hydrolase [Clostridia bacterium]|nr:MBL fold metallo-hydrolase [Clostridia bacterium]
MIKIAENVFKLEKMLVSQVYLIKDGEQVTIIDTGFAGEYANIKNQLNEIGIEPENINYIIITHGHMDHIANLKKLSKISGAKIFVHADDLERIDGKADPAQINLLEGGEELDILGGIQAIHIPGHSKGNMAFYAKRSGILFSGDCLFNNKGLSLPPVKFNDDTELFEKNVKVLSEYDISIICPGHGPHIEGNCNQRIEDLFE